MRIHLVGDAARQAPIFAREVPDIPVSPLPREAAQDPQFDHQIGPDDVVVSLRFRRPQGAPPFRLLHVQGAGLDGIDFASLREGCTVCNVHEHEGPIAEYVLMQMLQWEIRPTTMRFRADAWGDAFRGRTPHGELAGRTVAIIGFGRIGRAVARRARAFGMRVSTLDRSLDAEALGLIDDHVPAADLGGLLSRADYVVLSCPLTEGTRGLVGAAALAAMKPTAVLINVARAEVVDQHALYEALSRGGIAGAVLDVWYHMPVGSDDNPPPADVPLLDLPNVVATAYSAGWTTALPERRYRFIAENVRRLAAAQPLRNVVWPKEIPA